MTGYEWAYKHPTFNEALAMLQQARLGSTHVQREHLSRILPRASWVATLLSNSALHQHRQKALLFAALAKQVLKDDANVEALCYAVFARTGALPASMHLTRLISADQRYVGPRLGPLSDEFAASYNDSYSKEAGGILLTEFQKRASEGLASLDSGFISAPTSAGKSFIIHQYVKERLRNGQFVALFVVPTKALIAQNCAVYRKFAAREGVELAVLSSVPEETPNLGTSTVLALTQERCIRLLSSPIAGMLSFIFADEIQSLEDGGRGALLEYVLHELRQLAPNAKMFAAGPFIKGGQKLGQALFGASCTPLETQDSPVSQMVIEVAPVKGEATLNLRVVDANPATDVTFKFQVERPLYSRWRSSQTQAIADAVRLFKGNSPSVVYAKGPGTAQNWASEYARTLDPVESLSDEAAGLIEFIEDSVHPKCSLIDCLRRGVAYHHGALPDFVREEIESLFSDRQIDVLFCTSTLLEGVNLPAETIFVLSAKKADEQLTPFEFKNLIGRAGRLDQHLCGLVYCVQVPDEDEPNWLEAFRNDERKEVLPSVDANLSEHFIDIQGLLASGKPVTEPGFARELRATAVILRSRHLNSGRQVSAYLKSKGVISPDQGAALVQALEAAATSLTVPREIVLRNPYVDPVLQNQLYEEVINDPAAWKIRRERGFAADLETVFKKLDNVFSIIDEIDPVGDPSIYRSELLRFAKLWTLGRPFREIVTRALPSTLRSAPDVPREAVDKAIKKAMDIVTRDIAFVTAKYFSVLAEVLKEVVAEEEIDAYATTLALPVMLELGCSDPRALALIVACVPRAAAVRIAPLIPQDAKDPAAWLAVNQKNPSLNGLPLIHQKILRRVGIWT